jgi:hypothetical protein
LQKEFTNDEYTIINKKGLKNRINHQKQIFSKGFLYIHLLIYQKINTLIVYFHTFPKGKDKDFVLGVWEKLKK